MLDKVKEYDGKPITEVHIVGGVHPKMNMAYFIELMQKIKAHRPELHVKAFTAVELDYMFRKAKLSVQDGMDLSLVKVNKAKKEFIITGAKRPVAFIRDKQMQDLKGSKFSIGGMRTDEKKFEEIKISYHEDDMLYLYTDGYTDQFGGEKGKKFSSKRLKEHFLSIHRLSVSEQKQNLDQTMNKWMNELEQVDDMLIIGIKL